MRVVRNGPIIGVAIQIAVLGVLAAAPGLRAAGWLTGLACGLGTSVLLARALHRRGSRPGPADWVTLVRASLAGGVAALVADSLIGSVPIAPLVGLAAAALVLDGVDGRLARRTGTASELGARFDMEVDAFLIFALSCYAAQVIGPWVLVIGLARYAFVTAGWRWSWLRARVPARYWRKVVAAVQGIVLTVAAADVLPRWVSTLAAVGALGLLAESFGRDVVWLWRQRRSTADAALARPRPAPGRGRRLVAQLVSVLAVLLVWVALVLPDRLSGLSPAMLLRIPVEGLVLVAIALVAPPRVRRTAALVTGVLLGLLAIVSVLDMGFFAELDRPFDPVNDWGSFGPAFGVVRDSVGERWAVTAVVGAVALGVALVVLLPLAMLRVMGLVRRHRVVSARALGSLALVWLLGAALGVQLSAGEPLASSSAARLAVDQVQAVRTAIRDRHRFGAELNGADPVANLPAGDLLTGLRGKDVVVAFVESYGKVAVADSPIAAQDDAVLDAGSRQLRAAGFDTRSAFLTSPTFGGISWLAHSTLQSGLWIDNQQRYDDLVRSRRFTLSDAFRRAGWRTVGDVPSNGASWPEGTSFYHYDQLYNMTNVGYAGPPFSYARMTDQYVLSAFQHSELDRPHRRPVMAEIDLVSSHTPWAPLPHMVPWNKVGDGSIFDPMPAAGDQPSTVWRTGARVQAAYGQSIRYSITALVSWLQTFHDDNLVLVLLGDHQPATVVSGSGASHEVPITIVAHDPAVFDRIASWGWQEGMLPGAHAPVWPMDAFRDRFVTAFGRQPGASR